ncbi:hypothetical protein [Aeromonas veronii]|uniref:hypothetical protein n=1 Tax=Aeromonas veronii TaxID=654 RepID=UPI003D1E3A94
MEEVIKFWNDNYSNIMVSLGVGLVFFVLGPIGVWFSGRKIRRERIRKAKEMLIDLIEGMLVSQESITTAKLKQLFNAVEREVETSIDSEYDLERLFEDVSLRFQRSKHLDATQKNAYSKTLLDLVESIKQSQASGTRIIPRRYESIFLDLRQSIENQDIQKSNKVLDELEEKFSRLPMEAEPFIRILTIQMRIIKEHPVLFLTVLVIYVAFIIGFATGVIK